MASRAILIRGSMSKGITKRSARDEASLRVRILNGRHLADVYRRAEDELGERAEVIGPVDMSRNPLRSYVRRVGRAYLVPPLVSGLGPELAALIGDTSASTTVARYALAQGRPMPTRLVQVSSQVLGYRLAANFCGTLIGWSDRARRPYLEVVTPDDLDVEYASDDPLTPSVIQHYRRRMVGGREVEVAEVYDLTDLDQPSYRIIAEGSKDVTEEVLGRRYEGPGYWWRYEDGRPFHRIVISGDPREPYIGVELVDGSLSVGALYSHWRAGIVDAGHPQRNAVGLHVEGLGSDAETGETGAAAGPETVIRWVHDDPERPGSLHQWGPGFDPEVIGRAIRTYELGLIETIGVPVSFEATGGEPTAREAEALVEVVAATYPECRGHDGLVLRRVAAVTNRASAATEGMTPTAIPERAWGTLYREEIATALASVERPVDDDDDDEEEDSDG